MTLGRLAIGCLAPTLVATAAGAIPITFEFRGEVTELVDPTGAIASSQFDAAAGDPIVGRFTFDSDAPGGQPGTGSRFYEMRNDAYGMAFQIAGFDFVSMPVSEGGFLQINVHDNVVSSNQILDGYYAFSYIRDAAGLDVFTVHVEGLSALNLDVITSTALPTTPPDFSRFEFVRQFRMHASGGIVYGRIDSLTLVPEPGTASLLVFGLLGLRATARRRG
jgi:hypothetical protein